MSGCGLDEQSIIPAIHKLKSVAGIKALSVRTSRIGDAGAMTFAEQLPHLRRLTLKDCGVGDPGAIAIANCLNGLAALDLEENFVERAGATAIAKKLLHLTELNLSDNAIGPFATVAIAKRLSHLSRLFLGGCLIGTAGVLAVAEYLPALEVLDIESNAIGDAGAVAISERLKGLRHLDVEYNGIGLPGAVEIATHLVCLEFLDMGQNEIGEEGAVAIANGLRTLKHLQIGRNAIGDAGAAAIGEHLESLETLVIPNNSISNPNTIFALLETLVRPGGSRGLKTIDITGNRLNWTGSAELLSQAALQTYDAAELLERFKEILKPSERAQIWMGRVVMIGPTGHGKSHLAQWLVAAKGEEEARLRQVQRRGDGTWGADRLQAVLSPKDHGQQGLQDIHIRVVDCGGHPQQLQSHHNLFFSQWSRSVFLLCVRADQDFVESWGAYQLGLVADLKAIGIGRRLGMQVTTNDLTVEQSRPLSDPDQSRLHVILVPTHADEAKKNGTKWSPPADDILERSHPLLNLMAVSPWDAIQGIDIGQIKRAIGRQLALMPELRAAIPKYVLAVRDEIQKEFPADERLAFVPVRRSMTYREFGAMCERVGVANVENRHLYTLRELDNLGYVVAPHCHDAVQPENQTVLNPAFVQQFLYERLLNPKPRPRDGLIREFEYRQLTRDLDDKDKANLESLMKACLIAFEVEGRGGQIVDWLIPDLLEAREEWHGWPDAVCRGHLEAPGFLNESVFFEFARDQRESLEKFVDGDTLRFSIYRNGCVLRPKLHPNCQAQIRFDAKQRTVDIEVRGDAPELAEQWCRHLLRQFEHSCGAGGHLERRVAGEGEIRRPGNEAHPRATRSSVQVGTTGSDSTPTRSTFVPDFARCRIKVDITTGQVWLDGAEFPKRLNPDARTVLSRLIAAQGKLLPPDELMPVDPNYSTEHRHRVARVIEQLPQQIQNLISGHGKPGGGRVLKSLAYEPRGRVRGI